MISEQPEEKCIYRRIYLPYTVGIGNIFSKKDIEIVKRSTSFEREYNLKFLGLVGNVFLPEKIDANIRLGREHDIYRMMLSNPETVPLTQFYIGVDAGFGSSKFAIVLVCITDEKLFVLETIELDRQEFNYRINKISNVMAQYNLTYENTKIFIDSSSPAVVMAVKQSLDGQIDYLEVIARRT
jgi:hypothetical protein